MISNSNKSRINTNLTQISQIIKTYYKYLIWIIIIILLIQDFEKWIYLSLFVLFLIYKWDIRIIIKIGLIFLVSCPFLLILNKENLAEKFAEKTYYFLIIGATLQLINYIRKTRIKKNRE